ncbi:MAG: hypothetical protein WC955_08220 [Elusimicrobiota bacterium]
MINISGNMMSGGREDYLNPYSNYLMAEYLPEFYIEKNGIEINIFSCTINNVQPITSYIDIGSYYDRKFFYIGLTKKWNLPFGFYIGAGTSLFYYDIFYWAKYYVKTNTSIEDYTKYVFNENGIAIGIPVFIGYTTNWNGGLNLNFEIGIGKYLTKTEFLGDYFYKFNLLNLSSRIKGEEMDRILGGINIIAEYYTTNFTIFGKNPFQGDYLYEDLYSNINISGQGNLCIFGGTTELWMLKKLGVETGLLYENYSIKSDNYYGFSASGIFDFISIPIIIKKHFGKKENEFIIGIGIDNMVLIDDRIKLGNWPLSAFKDIKLLPGQILLSTLCSLEYKKNLNNHLELGIGLVYKKTLGLEDKIPFDDAMGIRLALRMK